MEPELLTAGRSRCVCHSSCVRLGPMCTCTLKTCCLLYFCLCVCVCVPAYLLVHRMHADAPGGQEGALEHLKLDLQDVVRCPISPLQEQHLLRMLQNGFLSGRE